MTGNRSGATRFAATLVGLDAVEYAISGAAPIPVEVLEPEQTLGDAPGFEAASVLETRAQIDDLRLGQCARSSEDERASVRLDGRFELGPLLFGNDFTHHFPAHHGDRELDLPLVAAVEDDGEVPAADCDTAWVTAQEVLLGFGLALVAGLALSFAIIPVVFTISGGTLTILSDGVTAPASIPNLCEGS